MSHPIAAIDESIRPGRYLLCATVVSTTDRADVRQSLRALLLPNQRRLHAHTEKDGRKRMLLKAMAEIPGITCHLAVEQAPLKGARSRCLHALVDHLINLGVRELLMDRVDYGAAKLDKQTMAAFTLDWRYEASYNEPLLWVSDAIVSAFGAGGQWRRAAGPLISTVLSGGKRMDLGTRPSGPGTRSTLRE